MIYEQDEYGQWLCPLLYADLEWDEGGETQQRATRPCSAPLHLIFEGAQAITSESQLVAFDKFECNTLHWRVECENRHVLLFSAGEEMAEPFELDFLVAEKFEVPPEDAPRNATNLAPIAVAPDLLAAAKALLADDTHYVPLPYRDDLEAAIAKAEGHTDSKDL